MRTVLIAVTGSSPAILTEAVWALAQETPPVIPDSIVTITTTTGAEVLNEKLLSPLPSWKKQSVWQGLRQVVLGKNYKKDSRLTLENPSLINIADPHTGTTRDLDDIRTPGDNNATAEAILARVRQFATDPDTRIIGLLSGGRKTMGALLHAALSLAGRPQDRLLHVLVSEPFDNPWLSPTFYFPGQPDGLKYSLASPKGKPRQISGKLAQIDLADVPLVALGELVFKGTQQAPPSFAGFARVIREQVDNVALQNEPIKLSYSVSKHQLSVNQYQCKLPIGRASALCAQLIRDAEEDLDFADRTALVERWSAQHIDYPIVGGDAKPFEVGDISNALNVIREKLENAGTPDILIDRLFPKKSPIGLNRDHVKVALTK